MKELKYVQKKKCSEQYMFISGTASIILSCHMFTEINFWLKWIFYSCILIAVTWPNNFLAYFMEVLHYLWQFNFQMTVSKNFIYFREEVASDHPF